MFCYQVCVAFLFPSPKPPMNDTWHGFLGHGKASFVPWPKTPIISWDYLDDHLISYTPEIQHRCQKMMVKGRCISFHLWLRHLFSNFSEVIGVGTICLLRLQLHLRCLLKVKTIQAIYLIIIGSSGASPWKFYITCWGFPKKMVQNPQNGKGGANVLHASSFFRVELLNFGVV